MALRDIRDHIAKTPQTDPNNFERVPFKRYPLMPLTKDHRPFLDKVGKPISVNNPDEEEAFYAEHPDAVKVMDPEDQRSELDRLRAENAKLKEAQGDKSGTAPSTGKDPNDKGDNTSKPVTSDMVQSEAMVRGGNQVAGLAGKGNQQPARPKPGSKLDD